MMTSIRANVPAVADADEVPWYDLIDDGYGEFLVRDSETSEWLGDLSEERAARLAAEARARELEVELERLRRGGRDADGG